MIFSRPFLPQHMAAIVASLMLGLVLTWFRSAPIEVASSFVTSPIDPGSVVHTEWLIRWHRGDCRDAKLSAYMVDPLSFHHALQTKELGVPPSGESQMFVSRDWRIPETWPAGMSIYRSVVAFSCFPFYGAWPIDVDLPTLRFVVDLR